MDPRRAAVPRSLRMATLGVYCHAEPSRHRFGRLRVDAIAKAPRTIEKIWLKNSVCFSGCHKRQGEPPGSIDERVSMLWDLTSLLLIPHFWGAHWSTRLRAALRSRYEVIHLAQRTCAWVTCIMGRYTVGWREITPECWACDAWVRGKPRILGLLSE